MYFLAAFLPVVFTGDYCVRQMYAFKAPGMSPSRFTAPSEVKFVDYCACSLFKAKPLRLSKGYWTRLKASLACCTLRSLWRFPAQRFFVGPFTDQADMSALSVRL